MLYDLNWLCEGQVFPPLSEVERLKTYRDNKALFEGDVAGVLAPYRRRVQNIVERFTGYCGWSAESFDRFELDLNYFQLMTLKTGDLIAGEPPSVTAEGGDDLTESIDRTDLNGKLLSIVYDVSRFGDSVVRLKRNDGGEKDFVVVSPSMWFPVVNREDPREILCHALVWPECLNPNARAGEKRKYVIKAQIHERGKYTPYTFEVSEANTGSDAATYFLHDGLNVTLDTFTLGKCIEKGKPVATGYDDFAVISFHNTVTPDSIFGINDYDRITPLVAELQVRYSLESLILDKHAAPTVYGSRKAFTFHDKTGEYTFRTGGAVLVDNDEQPPGYMIWDASLQANHTAIEKLEKHLYSLSEMGAIVNDDAFGASQGFEALETRMTNARLKARRMSSRLTRPLKKLLGLLSGVDPKEISVCWNDGLPNNEYRETDIATKQLQGGLFDLETVLQDHFDKTEEDAKKIAEKVRADRSNAYTAFDETEDETDEPEGDGDGA